MPYQYTKDEVWKIYEKLPRELQEAVFSAETADSIFNTCDRNDVEEMPKVARHVGLALMGLILPQEFSGVLEKEVGLQKNVAEAVARDINRLVFYPVRPALEQLHRMEIEVSARIVTPQPAEEGEAPTEKPKQEPRGSDTYREPIE